MRLFFIGLLWLRRGAKKILPRAERSQRNERGTEGCFDNEAVHGRLDWSRWIGWSERRAQDHKGAEANEPANEKERGIAPRRRAIGGHEQTQNENFWTCANCNAHGCADKHGVIDGGVCHGGLSVARLTRKNMIGRCVSEGRVELRCASPLRINVNCCDYVWESLMSWRYKSSIFAPQMSHVNWL